ncbi:hypothetical protein [Mangrovitalea sediminis]|uniref:hypothetical protein n=1 Tax=Mangrovitalea sediminis TaxID=1982043 RepID=UPI0011786E67|nr:hypothetical protein [Mangrovitalea sediminis]
MSLNKTVAILFVYFSFFPWVGFGILNMDIQPYYIIFGIMFLFLNINFGIPKWLYVLAIPGVLSIIVAVAYGKFDFITARAVASYLSVFVAAASFFICKKKYFGESLKTHLYLINCVWIFAGVLQMALGPYVLDFLVHVRTTQGRGVTGLAPEPTYYGLFLIFISILIAKEYGYRVLRLKPLFFIVINIFFVVLVAKSSMSIMLIVAMAILYAVSNFFKIKKNVSMLVISVLVLGVLSPFLQNLRDSRVGKIEKLFLKGPITLIHADASANQRLRNVVYPFYGAAEDGFIPHGYHRFSDTTKKLDQKFDNFFWWGEAENKIMSGLGAAIYELGFIGFFYFLAIFSSTRKIKPFRLAFFEASTLIMLMTTAIPLSFPLFPFILAANE